MVTVTVTVAGSRVVVTVTGAWVTVTVAGASVEVTVIGACVTVTLFVTVVVWQLGFGCEQFAAASTTVAGVLTETMTNRAATPTVIPRKPPRESSQRQTLCTCTASS